MNSKKIALLALMLALATVLSACGGGGDTSSSAPASPSTPSTPDSSGPAEPAGSGYTMQTNNTDKTVVDIGTFEGTVEGPVFITSVGQSADASMLNALMSKIEGAPEFTYDAMAAADVMVDAKTLIICSGASSKGLGAAGISADDEKARATAILEQAGAAEDVTVIIAHLGGAARRGALSDEFSDMCLPYADYIIVMEEGNDDGKFSDYAAANGIPITLVNNIRNAEDPLGRLFGGENPTT